MSHSADVNAPYVVCTWAHLHGVTEFANSKNSGTTLCAYQTPIGTQMLVPVARQFSACVAGTAGDAQVFIRSVCYSGPVYRVACNYPHTVYNDTCTCYAPYDVCCWLWQGTGAVANCRQDLRQVIQEAIKTSGRTAKVCVCVHHHFEYYTLWFVCVCQMKQYSVHT